MAQTKIWDGTKWVDYIMSSQIKLPLGSIGFSLDGILPEGAIAATGLELSREVYKDLWGFAQKGGETRLISEEAWQAELAANEGRFCRYYSTGNGATTFRIPYIACYLSGTAEAEKVGTYVTDTQRNITGSIGEVFAPNPPNTTGAFTEEVSRRIHVLNDSVENHIWKINFDASRVVGAEHTGEEVKPKTAYVLYYIQAFSTIINSGTLDIGELLEHVETLEKSVGYPLGAIYPTLYGSIDVGSLPCLGGEYNRETYKDLWELVQTKEGYVVTESEWQALNTANEGNVPKFSSGDGSTTFRLPKITKFLSGAESISEVGTYVTDTQRNITGSIGEVFAPNPPNTTGAFTEEVSRRIHVLNDSVENHIWKINFDASRVVGAEHTGEEVKPKYIKALYQIKAYGVVSNTGNIDVTNLAKDVEQLNTTVQKIKSFTDLSQIGLIKGTETLKSIGEALPENSQISYQIEIGSGHNSIEYPQIKGYFNMKKDTTYCYCVFATESNTKMFQRSFDYRDAFYIDANWSVMADNNKLSMPSNNKIIINLKNQGDSWTAPCDGYIWGMKVGGSNVVNSWLNVWDSTNADTTNYGTLIYCDYGQPYINLCGNLAIRKGQTVYFNWNNNCRVYFYPALNANMPTYGEDVRIYFKAVDSNNNIISGASFKISIADSSGDIVILSGKTSSDGRYLVPEDKWLSLTGLEDNQLITCTMTKGNATGSAEYRISLFKENMIYDLPITLVEGGGVIHNIDLELAVSGQIRCNKTSGDGNTQAYAGDEIILTAVPDVGVEFLNWQIINLTTLEKEIKIENPLTYIMPDSDIRVAADFNDDPIDIPIDPSSPSPAVDVYFKVLTNGTTTMGYNVTLYSPKGNVIWQGVTNSQGYVQLDPTLSFYAEDGMTLRAMKGSKFTQITVNKDSFSTDKADSNNAIWFTLTVGEMG